jgi:hypothetical protein
MRYRVFIIVLFMHACLLTAFAESYTFRVLMTKGDNKFKKSGTGQILPLKVGSVLHSGDVLIAAEGAYIGLMHKTGKTLEVRNEGKMPVSELEKQVKTGKSSTMQRLSSFVSDKLNEESKSNYRQRMSAGAITRSVQGPINVFVPGETSDYIGDYAILRWNEHSNNSGKTYFLTIKNLSDEVIFEKEINEPFIKLDFSTGELRDSKELYICTLALKNDPSVYTGFNLKLKEGSQAKTIKSDLEYLRQELGEETILNKLMLAAYFEDKGLLVDAITMYEEAMAMAPDMPEVKEFYDDFLKITRLKRTEK